MVKRYNWEAENLVLVSAIKLTTAQKIVYKSRDTVKKSVSGRDLPYSSHSNRLQIVLFIHNISDKHMMQVVQYTEVDYSSFKRVVNTEDDTLHRFEYIIKLLKKKKPSSNIENDRWIGFERNWFYNCKCYKKYWWHSMCDNCYSSNK